MELRDEIAMLVAVEHDRIDWRIGGKIVQDEYRKLADRILALPAIAEALAEYHRFRVGPLS